MTTLLAPPAPPTLPPTIAQAPGRERHRSQRRRGWVLGRLLVLNGIVALISIVVVAALLEMVRRVAAGKTVNLRDAERLDAALAAIGTWSLVLWFGTGLVWLAWQHRAHANLRVRYQDASFTPRRAVVAWFVPVASFVWPYRAIRELWTTRGTTDRSIIPVRLWWGAFLVHAILSRVVAAMWNDPSVDTDVARVSSVAALHLVTLIVTLGAVVLAIVVVRGVDRVIATPDPDSAPRAAWDVIPDRSERSVATRVGAWLIAAALASNAAVLIGRTAAQPPPAPPSTAEPPAAVPAGWTLIDGGQIAVALPAGFVGGDPAEAGVRSKIEQRLEGIAPGEALEEFLSVPGTALAAVGEPTEHGTPTLLVVSEERSSPLEDWASGAQRALEIPDEHIVDDRSLTIAGSEARVLHADDGDPESLPALFVAINGRARNWLLVYRAPRAGWDAQRAIFDQSLETVRLKP
ncbi:MAG TPA: DUF4328 domain-containing protein [Actinomycetota bacterium]